MHEPALAIEFLGSSSFRPEVLRDPAGVLSLLQEAAKLELPHSEAKERIQVRIITAQGLTEDVHAVLASTAQFLDQPIASARKRIALLARSFALAITGDLPGAFAAIDEATTLASGATAEYDRAECRAQRATFSMFAGSFAEAEAAYKEALDFFDRHEREGTEHDRLSVKGNLGICLLAQGRVSEAEPILRQVNESVRHHRLEAHLGLYAPPLGLANAQLGLPAERFLIDGLRSAYRVSSRRALTATAYAGRALVAMGAEVGHSVLSRSLTYRLGQGFPLNAVEQALYGAATIQRQADDLPLVEFIRTTIRACSSIEGTNHRLS
jgi:tetratricopeptide (TPR) repeat protein